MVKYINKKVLHNNMVKRRKKIVNDRDITMSPIIKINLKPLLIFLAISLTLFSLLASVVITQIQFGGVL